MKILNPEQRDTLFYAIHKPALQSAPEAPAYLIEALKQSLKAFINRKASQAIACSHDGNICRAINDLYIELTKD